MTMSRDIMTLMSDIENEQHSVEASNQYDVTTEEVLLWEAT